jgi:hypothetical protein
MVFGMITPALNATIFNIAIGTAVLAIILQIKKE